jgi:predicted nucleic acid-binding protein
LRLVVDANILLTGILGARSRRHLGTVALSRTILTSHETISEVGKVMARIGATSDLALQAAENQLKFVSVVAAEPPEMRRLAERCLVRAPASANGSGADAHLLALAWFCNADIWSHDRNFAGTGWPCWSSANLQAALDAEREEQG